MNTTRTLARQIASILVGATFLGVIIATASMVHEADMVRAFIGGDRAAATAVQQEGPACPAPQGLPGHVIVTTAEGETVKGGDRLVAKAFQHLVAEGALEANEFTPPVDHGFQAVKFCR